MIKDYTLEVRRKIFHLCAMIFPIIYLNCTKGFSVKLLLCVTFIVLILDIIRHYFEDVNNIIMRFLSPLSREREIHSTNLLSGASTMFLGFLISGVLFSKNLAINSWLILIISDSLGAICGKSFPSKEIAGGKTIIGSLAFFISAILITLFFNSARGVAISYSIIILSCFITTCTEIWSKTLNIDDNLTIPFMFCFATFILQALF